VDIDPVVGKITIPQGKVTNNKVSAVWIQAMKHSQLKE